MSLSLTLLERYDVGREDNGTVVMATKRPAVFHFLFRAAQRGRVKVQVEQPKGGAPIAECFRVDVYVGDPQREMKLLMSRTGPGAFDLTREIEPSEWVGVHYPDGSPGAQVVLRITLLPS